jgi:hypothetical protein
LKELYSIAEFLCSYIDFHHDLKKHSRSMLESIRTQFEQLLKTFTFKDIPMYRKKGTSITRLRWYTRWIQIVDDGYTQSNQLSQLVCEDLIETIINELLEFAADARNVSSPYHVINWIPIDKEKILDTTTFHVYDSVLTYNIHAINELRKIMHENGINRCLADTAAGFYKFLVKDTSPPLINMITPILGWDGSGGYKQDPSAILPTNVSSDANPLSIFGGAAKVGVRNAANATNATLTCTFSNGEIITIKGVQPLGLDRLLSTIGVSAIRSKSETAITSIKNVTFSSDDIKTNIILLKTWTDFVKIRILSASETPIGLTTNDRCCMRIAKMYGLPFVLGARNTGNETGLDSFVDVYCYDRHVVASQRADKKTQRILTFITVLHNLDLLNKWIKIRLNKLSCMLLTIMNHTIDPSLFFGIRQFLEKFAEYDKHADGNFTILKEIKAKLKQLDYTIISTYQELIETFPTTTNEWLHKTMNSNEIHRYFREVYYSLRDIIHQIKITSYNISTERWLQHYNAVSQHIVNATQRGEHSMDTYRITNIDSDTQQRYIISIFVVAFMEKGKIEETLPFLAKILENSMISMMNNTYFKSKDGYGTEATDYVTSSLMSKMLIPYKRPAAEWKMRLCAFYHAKKYSWTAPPRVMDRNVRDRHYKLEDVMNMYHQIISIHTVHALLMETILNIGCILAMMVENKEPFTFNKTEMLNNMNMQNGKPVPPPPESWVQLFGYEHEHTLSMIDAEPVTPVNPEKPCKIKNKPGIVNAFYGLINRIEIFMAQYTDCKISRDDMDELSIFAQERTRALWEEYPKAGNRIPTPKPIDAELPTAIPEKMPNDLPRRPPKKRKEPSPKAPSPKAPSPNNSPRKTKKQKTTKPTKTTRKGGQRAGTQKHNRNYTFPRRFSKTYCKKRACNKMGFTEKASCRPYKNCYRLFKKKSAKNSK